MIKKNVSRRYLVFCFFLLLYFVLCEHSVAKDSKKIGPVIGHKPTISNVKVSKTKIFYGDTVSVTYDYHDIDGDPPMINWMQPNWYAMGTNGSVNVKGDRVQILQNTSGPQSCAYENLAGTVSIKPLSKTGDPDRGDAVDVKISIELPISPQFQGYSPIEESYGSAAAQTTFLFSEAEAHCRSRGKKLPTVAQLKGFIAHYNNIMPLGVVKLLGFPAQSMCWGKTNFYWTSERIKGGQAAVSILDGTIDKFETNFGPEMYTRLHVMCVP